MTYNSFLSSGGLSVVIPVDAVETISVSTIAGMLIAGLLCVIIPIALIVVYKLKNREVSILNAVWGALGFFVFALVLEQLLHLVMLPIVKNNMWAYAFYGAFAAGIFEETARFLVFKTIMKKKTSPKDAFMYGIGHGGIEAVLLIGTTMFSYTVIAIMINAIGIEQTLAMTGAVDDAVKAVAMEQINGIASTTFAACMISVFERILAIIIHITLSIWVFKAAKEKKSVWLYPAAIVAHAAFDFPAALYQYGAIPIWATYAIMAVLAAVFAVIAAKIFKSMDKTVN